MLKGFALGVGAFLLAMGICLHCIDDYTVRTHVRATTPFETKIELANVKVVPPPWKPWAYIGAGIVLILWTTTLPKKMSQK
jgi:membrane-bound metal-dependent hydrolase YbcI (DUF457 family)